MRWRRLLVLAVIASLAVTAALAIGILLLGDFGETEGRVLATTFAISVASLLALPGAQLLDQERAVPLAWATLVLAALAFVVFEYTIWTDEDSSTARASTAPSPLLPSSTSSSSCSSHCCADSADSPRSIVSESTSSPAVRR